MDFQALFDELHIFQQLLAFLLGTPRLFMIMQIVPFMGGTLITGQLRTTIVVACYMLLHPSITAQMPDFAGPGLDTILYSGAIIAKEALIGLFIGYIVGMLFWAIQSAGFFIDNQRGASMASESDPLSGEQTSPLGSFFFQSTVFLFFASGAFLAFLGMVYASYMLWPVTELLPFSILHNIEISLFFAKQVGWLTLLMMLLAGPIVVACLLTDISLGLINRFASQLNVYVLAMPIKSGVAMFLLLFYFYLLMRNAESLFTGIDVDMELFRRILLPGKP